MPLRQGFRRAGKRPDVSAPWAEKKHYAEIVSKELAMAVAAELRRRGLSAALPKSSGESKEREGGEKSIAGGLGDKKVDVTYSTDRSGLVLAVSIKTISFPDFKTGN